MRQSAPAPWICPGLASITGVQSRLKRTGIAASILLSSSCQGEPARPVRADGAEPSAAAPAARTPPSDSPSPGPPTPPRADVCRALDVRGEVVSDGGGALHPGAPLDASPWLTLAPEATLVIKHVRTAREIRIVGPARVRPCPEGEEEALLLARGTLLATPGAGARPGAEVFVATPQGVVTYADARLRLHVEDRSVVVSVEVGSASLAGVGAGESVPVAPGTEARQGGPTPDVKALVAGCTKAADAATHAGRSVLDPEARGEALGARAGAHFRARRAARRACGIAAAALGLAPPNPELAPLAIELDAAQTRWRGHPGSDKSSNNANFR
jgi:hypothetical protein